MILYFEFSGPSLRYNSYVYTMVDRYHQIIKKKKIVVSDILEFLFGID